MITISKIDRKCIQHINRVFDKKFCIDFFEINDDALIRQFINILNRKEKLSFIKELCYYNKIYTGVSREILFKALLNKYKTIKLYDKVYSKANYNSINDYIEMRYNELIDYEYFDEL